MSPEREALSPPNLINPTAADFGGGAVRTGAAADDSQLGRQSHSHARRRHRSGRRHRDVQRERRQPRHWDLPGQQETTREDIDEDLCQGGPGLCNNATLTANSDYKIVDGRHHLIIETDTAANQPRIDDPFHRYLSTSGSIPGQPLTAGAFLTGSTSTTVPGHRIEIRFTKAGRYLVVCQNRGHLINDHMFGFVNVVDNDDKDDDHGHNDHRDK